MIRISFLVEDSKLIGDAYPKNGKIKIMPVYYFRRVNWKPCFIKFSDMCSTLSIFKKSVHINKKSYFVSGDTGTSVLQLIQIRGNRPLFISKSRI